MTAGTNWKSEITSVGVVLQLDVVLKVVVAAKDEGRAVQK